MLQVACILTPMPKANRRAVPSKNAHHRFTIDLDKEIFEKVRSAGESRGLRVAQTIRLALHDWIKSHEIEGG